jgi:SAM-dependent methyltransferase
MSQKQTVELEFSRKYDQQHAQQYLDKHRDGIARRLSNWRDQNLARKALQLAGDPAVVLDLPCGAGRFWPMLAEREDRRILAADNSAEMIATARRAQSPEIVARVRTFQTSAFDIDLDDQTVDCIFCMRLLHHVADPAHRLAMLREFHRVSRDTVIVSLWVDGNLKAWRRRLLEERRARRDGTQANQNRFIVARATIEAEFRQAGFSILGHHDFLPGYAMWSVYTLRKQALA